MTSRDAHRRTDASSIATAIAERGDSDITFVPTFVGESHYLLSNHFIKVIEGALSRQGIVYGDHPLLRPFIELHAKELTDFVVTGVGLSHQLRLPVLEQLTGDQTSLLRVDIWDSLLRLINEAEQAFYQNGGGLKALLEKIRATGSRIESATGV